MSLFSFGRARMPCALPFSERLWPGVTFFVILSGLGLWYGGSWTLENYRFSTEAQQAGAKVLRKYLVGGDETEPHIQYGYRVGNVVINCDQKIGRNTWDQLTAGGAVPIEYLAENPSKSRLANTAEDFMAAAKGYMALSGGLAAVLFGVVCTIHVHRRRKLVERLRTTGLVGTARLLGVDSETDGEGARSATLRFEFSDTSGQKIVGCSLPLSLAQERFWSDRATISVLYDPSDHQVFTVNPNEGK